MASSTSSSTSSPPSAAPLRNNPTLANGVEVALYLAPPPFHLETFRHSLGASEPVEPPPERVAKLTRRMQDPEHGIVAKLAEFSSLVERADVYEALEWGHGIMGHTGMYQRVVSFEVGFPAFLLIALRYTDTMQGDLAAYVMQVLCPRAPMHKENGLTLEIAWRAVHSMTKGFAVAETILLAEFAGMRMHGNHVRFATLTHTYVECVSLVRAFKLQAQLLDASFAYMVPEARERRAKGEYAGLKAWCKANPQAVPALLNTGLTRVVQWVRTMVLKLEDEIEWALSEEA
jgi:hypothetical protein